MGKTKRRKKMAGNRNRIALAVAVLLTALVIFYARGGFSLLHKLLFRR